MTRFQLWTPDHCQSPATGDACQVEEAWDDSTSDLARTHIFRRVLKTCSLHAALSGQALYDALYETNRRKNMTWVIAQSVKASLTLDQYQWSFDRDGVLTVNFGSALTSAQKTNLRNAAALQFGAGKVIVL